MTQISRRSLVTGSLGAAGLLGLPAISRSAVDTGLYDGFPALHRQRVFDTVLYAHSDLEKLERLVKASPSLANATIDWGFGDWETAIGAASHMGRRDIAEFLLEHRARPDLFTNAMLGHLDAVKATIEQLPGAQSTPGPHGITLLSHAKAGKATAVVEYLEELGGADKSPEAAKLAAAAETYIGTYAWGEGANERFSIEHRREAFFFQKGEDFPRALVPIARHEFAARAAPSVRLRFVVEGAKATRVTIHDPEVIVSATRVE